MKIKEIRLKAGITQTSLAEILDIPRATLATWESGSANPRAEIIPKIADALGCTTDQLFGRGEEVKEDA